MKRKRCALSLACAAALLLCLASMSWAELKPVIIDDDVSIGGFDAMDFQYENIAGPWDDPPRSILVGTIRNDRKFEVTDPGISFKAVVLALSFKDQYGRRANVEYVEFGEFPYGAIRSFQIYCENRFPEPPILFNVTVDRGIESTGEIW